MAVELFSVFVICILLWWGIAERVRANRAEDWHADAREFIEVLQQNLVRKGRIEAKLNSEIEELNKELERRQHIINAYVNTEGKQ
jgi:hypothetical protein